MKPNYPSWELLVVDNNSKDKSVKYLKKRFSKIKNCKIIQNPVNMYSQGLNLGAKMASGKYLAYFNNDVAIKKGYFQELVKKFEKIPAIAIAQGKLLNYHDHKLIDSTGETMDKYGNPVTIGAKQVDAGQFDKEEEILSASGSACLIRKEVFDKLKGYDLDFGIGYEDMDLALRARRLGYKVKRFPKAIVYHKRASTDLADFIKIKVKWHFNKNRLTTMLKNYPDQLLLETIFITVLLYIGITFWEWLVNKNWQLGKVRLSSIGWVIIHLPTIFAKRRQVSKMSTKNLGESELKLFSPKTLGELFTEFKGVK
jgi:hypothetical protein